MDLRNKTVVFTGKITVTRNEAWALVEKAGGTAGLDVSGKTDILVVGEKPGSKLARASLLGIKIISEKEFFDSLKEEPQQDIEVPLTKEELAELEEHTLTLICSNCGKTYRQFDTCPKTETCGVCEILLPAPKCPNCTDELAWIVDFNLYHCFFCGGWFKAPFSQHARKVKHYCFTHLVSQSEGKVVKECMGCGRIIVLRPEDIIETEEKYKSAPLLFKQLQEENKRIEEKIEKDKKEQEAVDNYIKSLTSEQIGELRKQYAGKNEA